MEKHLNFILKGMLLSMLFACQPRPDEGGLPIVAEKGLLPGGSGVEKPPANPGFDLFTTENGLTSNDITCVLQDRGGYLWIGTNDGLNRFDGHGFKTFRHDNNDPASLTDNNIIGMVEDSSSNLWLLTLDKGLCEWERKTGRFTNWNDTTIAYWDRNIKMTLDHKDRIWFNFQETYFDIPSRKFVRAGNAHLSGLNETPVCCQQKVYQLRRLGVDAGLDVRLWNEVKHGFDPVFQDTVVTRKQVIISNVNTATAATDGIIWAGTQDGSLLQIDPIAKTVRAHRKDPALPKNRRLGGTLLDVSLSRSGKVLWGAGFCTLVRCELGPDSTMRVNKYLPDEDFPKSIPQRVTTCVLEDKSGVVWLGTNSSGLCRYSPQKSKFEHFSRLAKDSTALPSNQVEALCFDGNDRLWVGTQKGLCQLADREAGRFETFRQPRYYNSPAINLDWVKSIAFEENRNELYLAYWGGPLDRFDLRTRQRTAIAPAKWDTKGYQVWVQANFVNQVFAAPGDTLYYANWGDFIQRMAIRTNELQRYCLPFDPVYKGNLPHFSALLTAILVDRTGNVWTGSSDGKGVSVIRADDFATLGIRNAKGEYVGGSTEKIQNSPTVAADSTKLQNGTTNCIFEDSHGQIWVGTTGGLHVCLDKTRGIFKKYGLRDGFPNENIASILEDGKGRLWLGTGAGLCCFDPKTGRVAAVFDQHDGLQGNSFSSACAKNSYGLMAFGGSRGFNLFHPDSLFENKFVPPVVISGVEVNGVERLAAVGAGRFSYVEKNFTFSFAALDFSDPGEIRYQYFLEGYEPDWSKPGAAHRATYTNLPPGEYRFRVRGTNSDGIWNMTGAVFSFEISPPFWATWWFRAGLAAVVLGAIWLFVKIREARLRQKQADNERTIRYLQAQTLQAQINPHFIFNVMGAMQNQILNNEAQVANRHLVNLPKLIRRFLDSSVSDSPLAGGGPSAHEIPLEQELELLQLYIEFEALQKPGRFTWAIRTDPEIGVSTASVPPMMVQPFVENAIKYGMLFQKTVGHLDVHFSKKDGDTLLVTIDDDGVGREKAGEIQRGAQKLHKSHGSRLVKERAAILNELGYRIDIETTDRPGGGTRVTIQIRT